MIYIVILGLACLLSLVANWWTRGLARQIGLVDRPDGHRKLQTQAVPVCGGIGIFLTIIVAIGAIVADLVATGETQVMPGWERYRLDRFDPAGSLAGPSTG